MNLTPAMQQFYELKEQNKDAVLFFRMGDFYEMFDEDAHIAKKVLGIAITTRNKNAEKSTPLAGFPYHAKEKYLPLLVEAGYKVAIAEQVSDPKLKGIVKREIVRVVTPATLSLEGEEYSENDGSIVAISFQNNKYGLSILRIGKNKWQTAEFTSFAELKNELYTLAPQEVVLEKHLFGDTEIQETLEKKYNLNLYFFEPQQESYKYLLKHFGTKNLSGFGIQEFPEAIRASSLLLEYLITHQKTDFPFLAGISLLETKDTLQLDEATIKSLDLIYNIATKSKTQGTLFGVLNQTKTSMGTAQLQESIIKPLQDIEEIRKRQNFVEAMISNKPLLDSLQKELSQISNMYAIMNRIALNRTSPRDLLQLKFSLQAAKKVILLLENSNIPAIQKILDPK